MNSESASAENSRHTVVSVIQRPLLYALLFTSGLCGISYEILYGRLLANIIGDQFIVSTAVLLTFLLGIGLGALHAHRFWRWLWLIEAIIGLYAAIFTISLPVIESFLYTHFPNIGISTLTSLILAIVLLLIPAFLIGMSLPLFSGYAHRLRPSRGYFAFSYGVYNFGAALTVIFIEFWLIRETGIRQAVFYMGAFNALAAIGLLLFFRSIAAHAPPQSAVKGSGFPRRVLAALVISSIGSAVFQLTAVRLSEMLLGPFRESFAYVLCIILLGIAIGSFLVNRFRIGFVPLLVSNIIALSWVLGGLHWVMEQFAGVYPLAVESYWQLVALKFGCVALIALGPAITFGATIPALLNTLDGNQLSPEPGNRETARSPGYLLFVASIANAAGFLLMSLVLHQRLDYGDLLLVIALLSGLSLLVIGALKIDAGRKLQSWSWSIAVCLIFVVIGTRTLWNEEMLYQGYLAFESSANMQTLIGKHATSERYKGEQDVLSISRRNGAEYFFINGQISIRLEDATEKIVGAIGAVFAPDQRRAMVLGVGSGATAASVALVFDDVEAVEISRIILDNLPRLEKYNFGLADMPNVKLLHDDAIHAVKVAEGEYSLILNTVTSPLFFSSSKLYTTDFLAEVQRHLVPGGLYVTWLDSRVGDKGADIMIESVTQVFDHCGLAQLSSTYLLVLCSDAPIVANHPAVVQEQSQLAQYFRDEHGIDPRGIAFQLLITDADSVRNPTGAPLNTLDKPVLSFEMARVVKRGIPKLQERILQKLNMQDLAVAFRNFNWGFVPLLNSIYSVTGGTVYGDALYRLYEDFSNQSQQAKLANEHGDCEAAFRFFSRAMEIEGRPPVSRGRLGLCYEEHGVYATALEIYRGQLKLHPENSKMSLLVARVLISMERFDDARLELQKVSAGEQSGAHHYLLGQALEKLGLENEASQHYLIAVAKAGSLEAAAETALQDIGE